VGGFNAWIAAKFHTSRERIVQVELGGLFALGFTLMQIGEWAASVACWVTLTCIFFAKLMAWEGVRGQKGLTAFLRISGAVGVIAGCVVLVAITALHKPENEPWSNLQKPWPWLNSKKQQQQSEVVQPESTESPSAEKALRDHTFYMSIEETARNRTLAKIQLMPPTYEEDKQRVGVDAVEIAFHNGGSASDQNISMRVKVPYIKDVVCDNPTRMYVIGGGARSTVVQLLAPELVPNEVHDCTVHFLEKLSDLNTVTAWKQAYGTPRAWSKRYDFFDPFIYRIRIGNKAMAPPNSGKKYVYPISIEPY